MPNKLKFSAVLVCGGGLKSAKVWGRRGVWSLFDSLGGFKNRQSVRAAANLAKKAA